jgi:PEP-CTERM/exosortase A-associated glycosyltransferase
MVWKILPLLQRVDTMRILHILDHSIPLHSGYTFRTLAILEQQRALGWETFHITSPKHYGAGDRLEEEVDGLKFYRSRPVAGLQARLPVVNQLAVVQQLVARLDEVIQQVQPDVLHAHSPALNGLAALRAGRKYNIPVVYEVRAFWEDAAVDHGTSREKGIRYRLTRAMETYVLRHAAAVTTICGGLKDDIVARGIAAELVTVIPNSVDLGLFRDELPRDVELARELRLDECCVLGFIGSYYAYEGLRLLLQALPTMLAVRPDIRVLLVGGGPQEPALRELVASLDIGDSVRFVGRVPHDQVQRYYSLVDVFVYPREKMRLTDLVTPLKPLEAMAQRRLVVASDVGGHRELIEDGVTGELFPADDAGALAQTVLSLLHNKDKWEQRRDAARRFVEQERNWKTSVARYAPVYERVCAGSGHTHG